MSNENNITTDTQTQTNTNTDNQMYNNTNTDDQTQNNNFYSTPEPPSGQFYAPTPEPPAKKKKKWPIAAGIAGALVIAGGTAASWWFFFRTPSFDNPTEAVTACISQLEEQFSREKLGCGALDAKLDQTALLKNISDKGSVFDMSLTLEDSNISQLSSVNGITVGLTLENDVQNNLFGGNITAYMYGMGGDIEFYTDSEKFIAGSEEFLPDSCLSVKKEDLIKRLAKNMDEEDSELLHSALAEPSADILAGLEDYSEYAISQLPDSLISFAGDCDIQAKDKDSIKIQDTEYDCHTYEITISAKAFQAFADEYCSYLADYEYEDNDFFSSLGDLYKAQSQDDSSLNDVIRDKLTEIPASIHDSSDETLDLELYISDDCELLGIQTGDTGSGELSLMFGGEHPGQEIYFTFEGENADKDLTLALSCVTGYTKEEDNTSIAFSYSSGDDTSFELLSESKYSAEDDSFKTNISVTADNYNNSFEAALSADGVYSTIEEGMRYTMIFEDLDITAASGDEEYSLELSGSMTAGVLDEKIAKPSGKEYDVLNLNDEDITTLLDELKDNTLLSILLSDITAEDVKNILNQF